MSIFLQVYGGCAVATLVGFLALCRTSASRLRHGHSQSDQLTGEHTFMQ